VTRAFGLDQAQGQVEVPAEPGVDVWVSVVAPGRGASEGAKLG
jgi:hypothetical protein